MLSNANRHSDEMQPYMAFHEDGLIDITIGLGLLLAAFGLYTDLFWIAAIYPALLVALMPALKKAITAPRIKRTAFSAEQLERIKAAKRITMLLGVFVFALISLTAFQNNPSRPLLGFGIALILVSLLAALAYAYEISRFYAYAGVTAIIIIAAILVKTPLPVVMIILGGICLGFGLNMLRRFISTHPIG